MVIIIGTQFFEDKEHRYADYPITDVLQMIGRACLPQHDDTGRCVLTADAAPVPSPGQEMLRVIPTFCLSRLPPTGLAS